MLWESAYVAFETRNKRSKVYPAASEGADNGSRDGKSSSCPAAAEMDCMLCKEWDSEISKVSTFPAAIGKYEGDAKCYVCDYGLAVADQQAANRPGGLHHLSKLPKIWSKHSSKNARASQGRAHHARGAMANAVPSFRVHTVCQAAWRGVARQNSTPLPP